MSELNDSASPEGQTVFDALHKTLDCSWVEGDCINVLDQVSPPTHTHTHNRSGEGRSASSPPPVLGPPPVRALLFTLRPACVRGCAWGVQVRIVPPYGAEQCTSLDGDVDALGRIVKIVNLARAKMAEAAAPPPGL